MKGKIMGVFAIMIIATLTMCGLAAALPAIDYIKINGDVYKQGADLTVDLGEDLDIRVKVNATDNEEDVELDARIRGYEYSVFEDGTDDTVRLFDMDNGTTVFKNMQINVPEKLEKGKYDLKVTLGSKKGTDEQWIFPLNIEGQRHKLTIKKVIMSPYDNVKAGRSLYSKVTIENYGEHDEADVLVTVSIPELGIQESDYIDEIKEGDSTTSEELWVRIPECAEPGIYDVEFKVGYDEEYEQETMMKSIAVVEGDFCEVGGNSGNSGSDNTQTETSTSKIIVGSIVQQLNKGEGGAIYPFTISNAASQAKSYMVSVQGADAWASVNVNPTSTVVLQPGESKAVYVYVSANEDAAVGEHVFSVTVAGSDGATLKEIPLTAQVTESAQEDSWEKVKNGLEIGLVVLVVLLVILGLIIGFNKLKEGNDEDEDDEEAQTYY